MRLPCSFSPEGTKRARSRVAEPCVASPLLRSVSGQCAARSSRFIAQSPSAPPVARIELEPYLGLWHEQARLPNSFERGCVRATAQYGQRDDGLISVVNMCYQEFGETRDARGRARIVGEGGEGKLKVSFFGPFWADYWVLERAPDYSWSIVGEPEGRYLWLLTRAERLTPETARRIRAAHFQSRISAQRSLLGAVHRYLRGVCFAAADVFDRHAHLYGLLATPHGKIDFIAELQLGPARRLGQPSGALAALALARSHRQLRRPPDWCRASPRAPPANRSRFARPARLRRRAAP